jgi:hypothetical protein
MRRCAVERETPRTLGALRADIPAQLQLTSQEPLVREVVPTGRLAPWPGPVQLSHAPESGSVQVPQSRTGCEAATVPQAWMCRCPLQASRTQSRALVVHRVAESGVVSDVPRIFPLDLQQCDAFLLLPLNVLLGPLPRPRCYQVEVIKRRKRPDDDYVHFDSHYRTPVSDSLSCSA